MISFDKNFHPVVLYENYLICIFMIINEDLKIRENHWKTTILGGNQTYSEHLGHLIMDDNSLNGTP